MSQPADSGVPNPSLGALGRSLRDPKVLSLATATLVVVAGLVELLLRGSVPAANRADDVILIALTVASGLSLALMWWSPFVSLSAAGVLLCVQAAAGYEFTQAAVWAVVVTSFATVAFDRWRLAIAAGFIVTAGLVFVFATGPGLTWGTAVSVWASLSLVWIVAVAIRLYRQSAARAEQRAALFAADREARAREAVAEERSRLARELHDSVGHALNVVVLHAGAAQRVLGTRPDLAQEALANIEVAGRQALGDIERMLGILRATDEEVSRDAAPGIGQIETLCDQVRVAGLPVELAVVGQSRPLPASVDLTAYRIVQEALTNTLKHAGRTRARVRLAYESDALRIDVEDDGRGVAAGTIGGGRGLMGMRERVLIFGGDLEAGARAEGGFAVRARLPLRTEAT